MGRINRKQAEFILGEVTIPCVTMVNEVIGMTVQGTQLLINTYFGDLSEDRKSTRLNSSHTDSSRMPSSA